MAACCDALVDRTDNGFDCSSKLEIAHSYHFVKDIFKVEHQDLANSYKEYQRVLALVDHNIYDMYADKINAYFNHHGIKPTLHRAIVEEDRKDMETMLSFCDEMNNFSAYIFRRGTRYIRVPTTLVGLIDASVSNRVAVNWNGLKNRVGGYHEPAATFIDYTFLQTIPEAEIRNGISELIKIFCTTHHEAYTWLEKHGKELITTRFGLVGTPSQELIDTAPKIIHQGILSVLELEIPNSREHNLNRVMYFGHTWSNVLELAHHPEYIHGHAIAVDMAYSATLSLTLGHLSESQHRRLLHLFSDLDLTIDSPTFSLNLLHEATDATIRTRNGHLRAPLPVGSLGEHIIAQDVEWVDLESAWWTHKEYCLKMPRRGLGVDATIDIRGEAVKKEVEAGIEEQASEKTSAEMRGGEDADEGYASARSEEEVELKREEVKTKMEREVDDRHPFLRDRLPSLHEPRAGCMIRRLHAGHGTTGNFTPKASCVCYVRGLQLLLPFISSRCMLHLGSGRQKQILFS